jgi:predicted dehydrogenase
VLLACQAGKDIYVEKPCSHTIHEGRAMVDAARRYNRIVQVGQQQRSDPHFIEAMRYLHSGKPLGRIVRTLTLNYDNETPDGMGMGGSKPPDRISAKDYDMWLGPAPKRPFNSNRFHNKWRWFFDYASGMVGDWNVHIQDIVHWGMKVDAPKSVFAVGRKTLPDNRDTPDMIDILYEYEGPDGPFTQNYVMGKTYQRGQYPQFFGTEFFGADGALFINRFFWEVKAEMNRKRVPDPDQPGKEKDEWVPRIKPFKKGGYDDGKHHVANFLDCVRSRKVEDLHCDIETGHHIAAACHLGNIAWHVGRKIWWDAEKEIVLQQDGTPDKEANRYLTKEYRKGYELPKV